MPMCCKYENKTNMYPIEVNGKIINVCPECYFQYLKELKCMDFSGFKPLCPLYFDEYRESVIYDIKATLLSLFYDKLKPILDKYLDNYDIVQYCHEGDCWLVELEFDNFDGLVKTLTYVIPDLLKTTKGYLKINTHSPKLQYSDSKHSIAFWIHDTINSFYMFAKEIMDTLGYIEVIPITEIDGVYYNIKYISDV